MIGIVMAAGLFLGGVGGTIAKSPAASRIPLAQYDHDGSGGYVGTGKHFGKGWSHSKRRRSYSGTGGNFGGGFEGSRSGKRWTGTGKRFGGGYDVQAGGRRLVGTGSNFGRGWERQGSEWVGTGDNFGKRCPATPGSTFVPCM
jgi:hypothetical protein